jgi:hypothetical protein
MGLGVCRRTLVDPNDVEHAFQATFLELVRRARSVRVGDSLGRWLYGVARRVAAKARARTQRDRVQTIPMEDDPIAPDDQADQIGLLAATIGMRRWPKYVDRVGVVLLAPFTVALVILFFLANDTLFATIHYTYEKISGVRAVPMVLWRWLKPETFPRLRDLGGTIRAAVAVILAALCAVSLVVTRRRLVEPPARWPSAIRLGILTIPAVLAALCAVDACLIGFERNAIRDRIARGLLTVQKVLGNSDDKQPKLDRRNG